jgi:ADP-heptose:LPS heptosyltransferase
MAVAPPDRILVIRVLGLGDLLTAVPALRGLRRAYPGSVISLASPGWLRPLLGSIDAVDDQLDVKSLAQVGALSPRPDLVVNLHGAGPQSIDAALRTGAETIITHRHSDRPGVDGPDWVPDLHEVERWCRLLRWSGLPVDAGDLRLPRPAIAADVGPSSVGAVVIHPGASAGARRWPVERFGSLAAHLARSGCQVLVTGSETEFDLANAVVTAAGLPNVASVAGRLGLDQLAVLIAGASLVICGDTGVAHLASAYATPSVLLFGPTPPALWGPPVDGPHTVLWHGGRGDPHADATDPGLLEIGVEEVLAAVEAHWTRTSDASCSVAVAACPDR